MAANSTGRIVLANTPAERRLGYASGARRGQLIEVLPPARRRHSHVGHRSHYFGQPRTRTMDALLSMEDFGNADASLAYLKRFPFDFVKDVIDNRDDAAITSASRAAMKCKDLFQPA